MSTTVTVRNLGSDCEVSFAGLLDEYCRLPEMKELISGRLIINLEQTFGINSMGCRKWAIWLRDGVQAKGGITLINCTPALVNQINLLPGFVPELVTMDSFYVPYTCDSCQHEDKVLLTKGKEFDFSGKLQVAESIPCPKCKSSMSMDVVRDRYFKFLAKRAVAS